MASSDDEGELVVQSVTNYHFVDGKEVPISFSVLPIQWSEDENSESMKRQVFLHGTVDHGFQKIYKQVTAWKFELFEEHPEIFVISKEKTWIKLQKPRKSFEYIVRKILITVRFLGFVKKNPDKGGKSLWNDLREVFSTYDPLPSVNDLLGHLPLIHGAVKHDEALSKSEFLLTFLENPKKRKTFDEGVHIASYTKKSKFIVDDDDDEEEFGLDVCAICDNGGNLVTCEGRCLRSFHGTMHDVNDSDCESLCLSKAQMEGNFVCANCQYKQHQCYACGKLGSSDKDCGAEVFPCVSATCGHFYHPECVAKLLHPKDQSEVEELRHKIAAGESFTCPAHRCHVCKQSENLDIRGLCFALCRRCPRAYHRNCLPRKIAFKDLKDEGIITRAWDGVLPNKRALIYCLKHDIDQRMGTPERNIIFPNYERRKKTMDPQPTKDKVKEKRKSVIIENYPCEKITVRQVEKDSSGKDGTKKKQRYLSGQGPQCFGSFEKPKTKHTFGMPLKDALKSSMELEKLDTDDVDKVLMGEEKLPHQGLEIVKYNPQDVSTCKLEKPIRHSAPMNKQSYPQSMIDAETKKKIAALMEKVASSITWEEEVENHKVPSTYAYSMKNVQEKIITLGKVEVSVEAVRIALQKLEDGCSAEDAKTVCGPEILNQIIEWRNKLKIYLAPFLHGMRYTSFGRHFTNVDKLKEIVGKLHCYVRNGDVVVDFCCGANDFSRLMKEKLSETGKKCSFRNYDIFQAKDDFCFEKRDWMEVSPKELPTGSKLIMGLNPPFGVKAAMANKFIDKALEFGPKLLILIVPEETTRLDKKDAAYNLIWEDGEKFSGKSFYLPGSVDVNDNQMEQWNVKPPHLYLWSRADWTAEHKAIALKHGHLSKDEVKVSAEENHDETEFDHPTDISPNHKGPVDTSKFIKEDGGHSCHINSSPQEQSEAKPGDSNSEVPQNQDKSPLPEHCTAADHNDHSVKKRSLKKRKVKNKGIPSRGVAERPETKPCSRKNYHYLSQPMGMTRKWSAGVSVDHDEYGIRGLGIQTNYRSEGLAGRSYFHHQDNELSPMVLLPSTACGVPDSSADVNYGRLNPLNMPRYAPHYDALNHRRMNPTGSQYHSGTRAGFRPEPLGFAPGPWRPFLYQNSSGWLN